MKGCAAIIVGMFVTQAAIAGGSTTAHVTNVRIDQTGKGFVYFDQNLVGLAGCVMPTYENALAFDANTAGGKAIMARALAAKATGDLIKAYGSGSCTIYGSWAEDWLYGDNE